jgi:hypothetical protein
MKLFYLAHPVAPDDLRGLSDNLAHTEKVAKILHDVGFEVICNWYLDVTILDDADPGIRERGLGRDFNLIIALKGNMILTGHKISSGMEAELVIAKGLRGTVINLIGISDEELKIQAEFAYGFIHNNG